MSEFSNLPLRCLNTGGRRLLAASHWEEAEKQIIDNILFVAF